MSDRVKNSGGAIRVALIGVATIMLGGCSETGQLGNAFGTPYASSSPRVDRSPTGSVSSAPSSQSNSVSNFFTEAFRPFDDKPAAPPPRQTYAAPRASQPAYAPPIPPAPISAAPLAPPSPIASAPLPSSVRVPSAPVASVPTYAPSVSRAVSTASRSVPATVGGWTSEGGTPITVGQGESAESVAQRFGVPTATLLTLNGLSSRAQVQPGTRLNIPVYHATGARTAAIAPAPVAAPVHIAAPAPVRAAETQRYAAKSLVAEETEQARHVVRGAAPQPLALPKVDPAAQLAEKRAKLAQAQAEKLAKEKAEAAKLAQIKAEKEKARFAKAEAAKVAMGDAAKKAAEAKAAKEAAKLAAAQAAATKSAAAAQAAQAKASAAAAKTAAVVAPAKVEETTKVAKAEAKAEAKADAETTASLPPATTASASADSANPEFRWPARGRVIQGFGNGGNDGINIAVPEGTQVKAAESGVVAYSGSELKGYGNLVLIRHPNGFVTAYANNGSLNVKRGETVKRGQTIALSGQSGNVSSPQLHFELRKGSKPVDPSSYLAGL